MVKKKNTKTTPVSAVLPPSDLLFLLRGQLQGSMKVRSMKVSTNQWHNYGSVHLAIFDHLWVFEIVSGLNSVERTNSEEHCVTNLHSNLLSGISNFQILYLILASFKVAFILSPTFRIYHVPKLQRKIRRHHFSTNLTYANL